MSPTTLRRRLLLPIVLLLALLVPVGCTLLPAAGSRSAGTGKVGTEGGGRQEDATPTPIPTAVAVSKPTYTTTRGTVTRQLTLSGRISPVKQQELFFRTSGRVSAVYVESGDMVKTGQVLAELENANVLRDLTVSQLDLARAQARLKEAESSLQASINRAQANLDIARENLAIIKAQDPAPRKTKAEVALQRADLARKQAQEAYDAIAWRNDRGASQQAAALQQATWNYIDAQTAYELALQEIAVHDHQVTIAERQVDLAQLTLDGFKAGVDPLLVNDVSKAQLAVTKLQAAVADTQIIASSDGEVQVAFALSSGAFVDAFRFLVTVSDISDLEVRVDSVNLSQEPLSVGMPVTVTLIGRPGVDLKAHVQRLPASGVLVSTDQDRALHIAFERDGAPIDYQDGDLTRVTIILEQKQNVLWLPPAAIRTFEGRRFVVVQDGAVQRRVDIKVGLESEDRFEIASGLSEGQIVVGQ